MITVIDQKNFLFATKLNWIVTDFPLYTFKNTFPIEQVFNVSLQFSWDNE